MRVFCAVRHSADPSRHYGGLWSGNFYPALRQMGHEIVESQVDLAPLSDFMGQAADFPADLLALRARITQQIIDEIIAAHQQAPLDLVLTYFYAAHFEPAGFDAIHRLGIPTINFYCNSMYQFQLVAPIAAKVQYSWHAEKHARELYLKVGANPVWVQMGAAPEVYRPMEGLTRASAACFVGQKYADRDRWAAALVKAQTPLVLYGPGWGGPSPARATVGAPVSMRNAYAAEVMRNLKKHGPIGGLRRSIRQAAYVRQTGKLRPLFVDIAKGPIPFEKIREVFGSYEVILNFSNVWSDGRPGSKLIPHVRLRDFEAPMCRTCYLSGHTDEIAEFYEVGKEIDTYRTPEELVDKTRYYLAHPAAAEAMRDAGYARARRDHTWQRRFEQLFRETRLSP